MEYSRFVTWNIEKHLFLFIFSMRIVSTLLSRLLFLTLCIFNVNIYPIYQSVCFFRVAAHVRWRQAGVLSRPRPHKLSRPSTRDLITTNQGRLFLSPSATPQRDAWAGLMQHRLPIERGRQCHALSLPPPPPTTTKSQVVLKGSLCVCPLPAVERTGGAGLSLHFSVLNGAVGM